ncbi:M48 family metalloprotease [Streptomyces sp. NPDC056672]|uniref:M48 family metalloprotease n=1 Tax=Streptomyces sp. NPDC056672 TaxID=3345906 RepID=UPI0036760FEC
MKRPPASGGLAGAPPPPPWLWLAMASYVQDAPAAFVWWRAQLLDVWTAGEYGAATVSTSGFAALRVMLVSQLAPLLFLTAGVATVLLPHVRGRYTEWRYHLGPVRADLRDGAAYGPSPAVRSVQRLLDEHAPGTVLTLSTRARGPSIRVYARGWRGRRVAVSLGFLALWESDQDRARALLLHEAGHLVNGEHLITGLGSPFTRLIGAWPVLFLVCAVAPLVWLTVTHAPAAPLLVAQVLTVVVRLPQVLILPVIALWCAELAADRYAVAHAGRRTVLEALDATRTSGLRHVLGKLYHPPSAPRRWFIERSHRPVAPALLLLAGPIALLLHAVVVTCAAIPGLILLGDAPGTAVASSLDLAHRDLLIRPRWAIVLAVVLLWPLLARPWLRLWGAPRIPYPVPHPAPYRLRTHLAAALLPALVLAVALLPRTGAAERDPVLRPGTATVEAE